MWASENIFFTGEPWYKRLKSCSSDVKGNCLVWLLVYFGGVCVCGVDWVGFGFCFALLLFIYLFIYSL